MLSLSLVLAVAKTLLNVHTLLGAVGGSVATVASPKVFAWVKKQFTSVKADASAVVTNAETTVVADVKAAVANAEAQVVSTVKKL